ncbi:MAG TPA: hypothetical protein VK433_04990 [Stellaceae bacterium]|nr:hypothetical protein [Stellaceae bacterium]
MSLQRAKVRRRELWKGALFGLSLVLVAGPVLAAASVTVTIDGRPKRGNAVNAIVEDTYTIVLTVTNGKVSDPIPWPQADGLRLSGSGYNPHTNGYSFFITPLRAGDFEVPAFDFKTDDGQTLHVDAIKFHVADQ